MIAPDRARNSAPLLRKSFTLDDGHGAVVEAELVATALGVCEISVNGMAVSADLLTPGWSSYEWRLRYARWDVLNLIEASSVIGVIIGAGWHTGRLGFMQKRALYGDSRAALVELRIAYEDGHEQLVPSDESWESGPSDVLTDDLYDGQTIDARRRTYHWCAAGPAPPGWSGVRVLDFDHSRLVPMVAEPVRRIGVRAPEHVWTSPAGSTLVDFGQNLVGFVRLRVRGPRGTEIVLRHAEVLEHGELGTRPLRTAEATDRFVLSGDDDEFEPTLTFHGFRYLEVTGFPGGHAELRRAVQAVVVGSDLTRIGRFSCSDPLITQLHRNIVWSMRGNFLSVPADCPQRDERLGWTGDLAAFVSTAVFLYDVGAFLRDWLRDLAAEQLHQNGTIPLVVPDNFKLEKRQGMSYQLSLVPHSIAALWNDAAAWVPWAAYEAYGDLNALQEQYPSMLAYGRRIAAATAGGVLGGLQFGDWLDPDAPPEDPRRAKADPSVVATACVFRSAQMIAAAARALGHHDEAEELASVAARIRTAFAAAFVDRGRLASDAPTEYVLAIAFDLVEGPDREIAGQRLAELVRAAGHRVTTGFAGTPFIATALAATGHLDDAYAMLTRTTCPSWLYPVTMGATTTWERWDSMLPDGSINPGEMTSFNHYAFGSVGEFLHRVVAGLAPLEPGYRRLRVAPRPGGGLRWARAALETPLGRAEVDWRLDQGELSVGVTVPEGATAVVDLLSGDECEIGPGRHTFVVPAPAEPENGRR